VINSKIRVKGRVLKMERLSTEELYEELSRYVNTTSSTEKIEDLAEKLVHDHPTLQQNYMRLAMAIIEAFANKGYVDGRNEKSKEMAQVFMRAFEKHLGYDEDDNVTRIHTYLPNV